MVNYNLFTAILASAVVGFFEGTIQTVVSLASIYANSYRDGGKCRNTNTYNNS